MQLIELQQSAKNEWDCESLSDYVGVALKYLASSDRGADWVSVALPDDVELTDELKARLQSALIAGKPAEEFNPLNP